MAKLKAPFALDRTFNTTEQTSRNIADVLAEELSAIITAIGGLNFINFEVVAELPTTGISTTTIYLVPSDDPQSGNTYDEYINLNGTVSGWEKIGSTDIDLSGYYTSAEVDALLADKADVSDIPTVNDGTLTIQQNGETKGTFTANQSGNSTVNIEIPTTDIQTAVDEFSTYNGGLLSSLKVSLTPNQDLHGYDSPWVGGAGKNLIPLTVNALKLANAWMTWNGKVATAVGLTVTLLTDDAENVIGIDVDGTASQRLDFSLGWVTVDGSYVISGSTDGSLSKWAVWQRGHGSVESQMSLDGAGTFTDTSQSSRECVLTIFNGATPSHQKFYPMLCLSSAPEPTVFAPYTNSCPISGHTQVDVGDDGKNKINATDKHFDANSNKNELLQSNLNLKAGTYTLSFDISNNVTVTRNRPLYVINGVNTYAPSDYTSQGRGSWTFTLTQDSTVTFYWWVSANTSAVDVKNIQLELGSTATAYVPYNGYQVTVNLGGTYYSGTLDVVTGVFTPDTASVDPGTLTWTYDSETQRFTSSVTGLKNLPVRTAPMTCEVYKVIDDGRAMADVPDSSIYNGNMSSNVYVHDSRFTAPSDLVTALSGYKLVYPLATPTPIQLIPTPAKALVGENHLSAPLEGQEITESKYKQTFTFDDVNAQIESTYSNGISHNSVYRGKYLGDYVTDEQWDAIGDGSFRDLYIGDYWTINGINWRIAHFNYWLGTGDVKCNTNHVVIVPYGWVSTFNMNSSDDTTGGYLNSEWYTTNRHFAVENIEADFGASHILSHRNFFSDAVSDGHASHGMWVDSTVDLMNEIMVCGSLIGSYLGKYYEVGCDKLQLALFKYNPPSARMDVNYWLRGVSTASSFVGMGNFGLLDGFTASQILRIRPVFAIKK